MRVLRRRDDAGQARTHDGREDPPAPVRRGGALVERDDISNVCAQSGAPVTHGTKPLRNVSAVANEQSWASLHRFGTTNATLTLGSNLANGWMLAHWAVPETDVKLIAGLCLRA